MIKKEELLEEIAINVENCNSWEDFKQYLFNLGKDDRICVENTNGLPFNGTTYRIYRCLEIDGMKLQQNIAHLKYVHEIYGNRTYLFVYDGELKGGYHLNNDESGKIKIRKEVQGR